MTKMTIKINSETAFFTLNGQEFQVQKVEAKEPAIAIKEQIAYYNSKNELPQFLFTKIQFSMWIESNNLVGDWEKFLISEARKRGFVSGCHFSDGLKLTYMPSGRMKLLTLSKLVTDCRNPTVIYDNGKWAEVIKKEVKLNDRLFSKSEIEYRRIIGSLTYQLFANSNHVSISVDDAKFIRDILNEKLNENL